MNWFCLLLILALGLMLPLRGQDTPAPDDPPAVALQKACSAGDINAVVSLILAQTAVDGTVGDDHTTPLMLAAQGGHLDVTLYLISKGAGLDLTDKDGNTPLNLACGANSEDCAVGLLKAGANPNLANTAGRTPLMNAAAHGNTVMITALILNHADVNAVTGEGSALWYAVINNKPKAIQALLNASADPNPKFPPPADPLNPRVSVLGAAAAVGSLDLLQLLMDNGAKIDSGGADGTTPLGVAAEHNRADVMDRLIRKFADVDLANQAGETPLILAASRGRLEAVQELNQNRARLDLQDKDGMTALMRACAHGQDQVVRYLIGKGADVNAVDAHGQTALCYAADIGDSTLVKALIDKGVTYTDIHILPRPLPNPLLSAQQTWALAVDALLRQVAGQNPHALGSGIPAVTAQRSLKRNSHISDATEFLPALQEVIQNGNRAAWQASAAPSPTSATPAASDTPLNPLTQDAPPRPAAGSVDNDALHESYARWHDRLGLAWDLCHAANLINLGYAAGYLNEADAWAQLSAIAQFVQSRFASWSEFNANFMDALKLQAGHTDPRLDACSQLLLNPKDPNSVWNQNPWKTDLAPPPAH